jgi:hypothetical protein
MLCSKKMILPSKFNVKLQFFFWEALALLGLPKNFRGGVPRFRLGGVKFFLGGGAPPVLPLCPCMSVGL